MRSTCSGLAVVLCFLMTAPRVNAQTPHVVSQAALDAAVQQRVSAVDNDRETVRRLLARDDVNAIAGRAGIDIGRAQAAVATLDATELASLAGQARQADQALAGGQSTITFKTTTIIIGLLVLILLIIVLR